MKHHCAKAQPLVLLAAGLASLWAPAMAQRIDFAVPPSKVNPVAAGMGDAYVADGTWFNAASYNPALLGQTPYRYEAIGIQVNFSEDLLSTYNYLRSNRNNFRDIYKNLKQGVSTLNTNQISQGLDAIQAIADRIGEKPYGVTGGPYLSARFGQHFGLQAYNNTNMLIEGSKGALGDALLSIPRPINLSDPNTNAALQNAVTIAAGDIISGINQVVPQQTQAAIQNEINALVAGTEDLDTFLTNVSTTVSTIDINLLKQSILNSLSADLASVLVVGYADTVVMGTYVFEPMPDLVPGFNLGTNLKVVNRRVTIQVLAPQDFKGNVTNRVLRELYRSSTRFGMDFGFLYEYKPWRTNFGLVLQDAIRNRVTVDGGPDSLLSIFTTDPGPLVMRAGVSWYPWRRLRINLDYDDMLGNTLIYEDQNWTSRIKFGTQYALFDWLAFRLGMGNQDVTCGMGVLFKHFGFDYAYANDNLSQRYSHFFQLRVPI